MAKLFYAIDDVKTEIVNQMDIENGLCSRAKSAKMKSYYSGTLNGLMLALQYIDAGERYDERDSGAVEFRSAKEIIQEVRNEQTP